MSYAVRKDGLGFRAVGGANDCTEDETFSLAAPELAAANNAVIRAQLDLNASDRVAIRCLKAGKAYPADWAARDEVLREIVRTGAGTHPAALAYPAGT